MPPAPESIRPLCVCFIRVRLGAVDYARPCVVLDVRGEQLWVAAISSKVELYRAGFHFIVRDDHPDFPSTGLEVTSYVVGAPIIEAERGRVLRLLGTFTGGLAEEFRSWIGLDS